VVSKVVSKILYCLREGVRGNRTVPLTVKEGFKGNLWFPLRTLKFMDDQGFGQDELGLIRNR
jgi:hypothetical protein